MYWVSEEVHLLLKAYYSAYTERRSTSENCIIDNAHCIVFSFLTLPLPSLLVPIPTPFTRGGGGEGRPDPPTISKTVVPMNKFCRVLGYLLNVSEMLKLFT